MKNRLPIIPVHHMEAHALTARMVQQIQFPFMVFLVSGGHCLLAMAEDVDKYKLLGRYYIWSSVVSLLGILNGWPSNRINPSVGILGEGYRKEPRAPIMIPGNPWSRASIVPKKSEFVRILRAHNYTKTDFRTGTKAKLVQKLMPILTCSQMRRWCSRSAVWQSCTATQITHVEAWSEGRFRRPSHWDGWVHRRPYIHSLSRAHETTQELQF